MSDAENAFRQQFSGWQTGQNRRGVPQLSEWTDYIRDGANNFYLALPMYNKGTQQNIEEPSWMQLSRMERIIGFLCCLAGSIVCFVTSFFLFPVLALKPRKFAMIWTLGTLLFVASFGVLQGPNHYIRHLISRERVVFTTVFVSSVLATIYAAMIAKSTLLTIFCGIIEIFAVLYYTLSYFPFGALAVTWFTSYLVGYFGGLLGGLL